MNNGSNEVQTSSYNKSSALGVGVTDHDDDILPPSSRKVVSNAK